MIRQPVKKRKAHVNILDSTDKPFSESELDQIVEDWFQVIPLDKAMTLLDQTRDAFFTY